jgi:hypothetical protein
LELVIQAIASWKRKAQKNFDFAVYTEGSNFLIFRAFTTYIFTKTRKYLIEIRFSIFFSHAQRVMALKALIASLAKKEERRFIFGAQPEK